VQTAQQDQSYGQAPGKSLSQAAPRDLPEQRYALWPFRGKRGREEFSAQTPTPRRNARFSQRKDVITFSGLIIFSTDFDIRLSTRSKK
jgi:hypothetical protein